MQASVYSDSPILPQTYPSFVRFAYLLCFSLILTFMASISSSNQQNSFSGIEPPIKRRKVEESPRVFDVFINHRGPDVKLTLATQLYNSLKELNIKAFLDSEEKELGISFPSTIEMAIGSASVHIAIFSTKYAESAWCLAELILMLQSNAKIIPVFYQVQPWEPRYIEKGVYAEAFLNYEEKGRYLDKIEQWKKALQQVSYTAGYEFKNSDSSACKDILSAVEKEVRRTELLHVAKYPVGLRKLVKDFGRRCLDELVEDFERRRYKELIEDFERECLHEVLEDFEGRPFDELQDFGRPLFDAFVEISERRSFNELQDFVSQYRMKKVEKEKVNVVGIYGMGGVGKTTLSKELFNKKSSNYARASFLFGVREACASGKLPLLQSKLLKDIFGEDYSFLSSEEGTSCLRDRLGRSSPLSFLIVLDDIDHVEQLDALLVKDIMNKSGNNLVIITTRDVGVLVSAGINNTYPLKGLNREDGKALFCWHAFDQPFPLSGYKDLVEAFVNMRGGLPLSLMALGQHVFGRPKLYWQDELEDVKDTLPGDIKRILKISIDRLGHVEKQIFMDIACFFIEESITKALTIWEGSGWRARHALQTLTEKCLVEEVQVGYLNWEKETCESIPDGSVLRMHQHLRDLGREMANELNHPPRVWHPRDLKSLESKGFRNILVETKGRCHHSILDESMGCRITYFLGEPKDGSDTSLLWLQLEYLNSDINSSIPSWIPLQNLQCLRINNGCFQKLWQSDVQAPSDLKELQIRGSYLEEIPALLGKSNNMEKIVLHAKDIEDVFRMYRTMKGESRVEMGEGEIVKKRRCGTQINFILGA